MADETIILSDDTSAFAEQRFGMFYKRYRDFQIQFADGKADEYLNALQRLGVSAIDASGKVKEANLLYSEIMEAVKIKSKTINNDDYLQLWNQARETWLRPKKK